MHPRWLRCAPSLYRSGYAAVARLAIGAPRPPRFFSALLIRDTDDRSGVRGDEPGVVAGWTGVVDERELAAGHVHLERLELGEEHAALPERPDALAGLHDI